MELPSVVKKHLGRVPTTNIDKLHLPLDEWLRYFFTFASNKKKNFYWAWKDFMIVVRHQKDGRTVLVLEIFLPKAPFLRQKHIDITHIPKDVLVDSLMFLSHHYDSSPKLRRNREHSVRFLSFISFAQMLANHDIKKLPHLSEKTTSINRLLVAYLMKTLDFEGVPTRFQERPDPRLYSVSQLVSRTGSLKP